MLTTHDRAASPFAPRFDDNALAALPLTMADEVTRIREHLLGAIIAVGARPVDDLSPSQRASRALLLGQLIRYAVAGRFPKNIVPGTDMTPTFVDHEGTRCAMACLIEHTGERRLVDRVASNANHAYVRELAADPTLVAWLVEHGLSAEEAARIQPGYCGTPGLECVCETTFVSAGDLMAGVVQADGSLLVDEVYKTASGIAVGDRLDVVYNAAAFEEGQRVFADQGEGGARLHYAFADADSLATNTCEAFFSTPPATLDIDVVLDIANGAECLSTLQAVDPAWRDEGECENGGGEGGQAAGGEGAGGADVGGGDVGGGAAVEDGGSSSGCTFTSLAAHESGLLFALMAGLAIARRRRGLTA
jgi:hypothetical protein